MTRHELKEKLYRLWVTALSYVGLTTVGQLEDARQQARVFEMSIKRLMEESGMNKQACCRHHATPAQRMTQMFVCDECGDKRCNHAEICRLPCNMGKEKKDAPLFV